MTHSDNRKFSSASSRRVWPWALAGAFFYALGLTLAPPGVRIPLNLSGACALTIAVACWYQKRQAGSRKRLVAWAAFVALSPTWLLAHALAAAWLLPLYHILPKWLWIITLLGYGLPFAGVVKIARTPPEKLRPLATGLTVSLLSCMLTLLALEAVIRIKRPKPASYEIQAFEQTGWFGLVTLGAWYYQLFGKPLFKPLARQEFASVYASNPRGYFEPGNRVTYRTNAAGFRDDEFTHERKPKPVRIALLGDSFAFGQGVKQPDTAAVLLETRLSARAGCPVEVYNFAVSGYNAGNEADLLEKTVWGYRPDVVIVWYYMNDIETWEDARRGGVLRVSPWFSVGLTRYSRLASVLNGRLNQATYQRVNRVQANFYDSAGPRWQALRGYLGQMSRSAQARQTPIMLLVHPRQAGNVLDSQLKEEFQVLAAAQELGFMAHSLHPAFAGYDGEALIVHPSDRHTNEIAHRLAAEYAADKIAVMLPSCPR